MRDQHDDARVTVRYATSADVEAYYGYRPQQTVRALVAEMNGKPVGIIGVSREHSCSKIFSEYGPELKGKLKCMAILRAIKVVMGWAIQSPLPVVAVAQPQEEGAPRLLRRLGFEFYDPGEDGDFYVWPN